MFGFRKSWSAKRRKLKRQRKPRRGKKSRSKIYTCKN